MFFSHAQGDCAHVAYNYLTALCLSRLQDHSSRQAPRLLHRLLLVTFVVGATIHLVADAVQQRLVRAGAKLHLPIHEQPLLQSADPVVVECFRFLDYLDEEIGHQIWYTALYLLFLLCFWSSFYRPTNNNNNNAKPSPNGSIPYLWLLFASVLHEWYAITEAQVLPHFIATSLAMMGIFAWYRMVRMESGPQRNVSPASSPADSTAGGCVDGRTVGRHGSQTQVQRELDICP
ncbi:Ceroid-lipofuscinosis neuronal protein 6 homolog [Geodia barretti]|uniref:Ceroid-lipofuscinosis neuronal protein 6 homolog n=1 Tax=Geodia barretti TaxID=519541 RepID=A0AA35WAZ6_GEOBA|nr:Ceroid-lipofuscinosis neuronal protein 6 homolog [Geodia barretti]